MKICILSVVNIKHMSMISIYTTWLKNHGVTYDIIYIDKYKDVETITASNIYKFPIDISRDWSRFRKLSVYYGFRKFASRIIANNKYDFLIIWKSETAFLFIDLLLTKFKEKYCLNIRDYFHEKNKLIYQFTKKLIKYAKFSTISSDGFKYFLPKSNYYLIHSLNNDLLEKCKPRYRIKNKNEKINICFIGYVRFFDIDKKIIDSFANDERFLIQFFGEGAEVLAEYAKSRFIENVEFINRFRLEDTPKLLEKADVINNLYGFNNIALDTAISIKFYYALYLKLPIMVFEGTYMEEISRDAGIGYVVNKEIHSIADNFYSWYHNLSFEEIDSKTTEYLKIINSKNEVFFKTLESIF